jgi:hypothetical protein
MAVLLSLLTLLSACPQRVISRAIFQQPGLALVEQARYEEAERLFRAWRAVLPGDADAAYHVALAAALQKRWLDARRGFMDVLAREPGRVDARFEIAATFLQTRAYEQARQWADSGLSVRPDDEYGLDLAGTAAFLTGERIQALRYWNRAGRPHLTETTITAEGVSRQAVADEIDLKPGDLLSWRAIERARWKIAQHGYLSATFEPMPGSGPDAYALAVSARGRRGFGSPWELLFTGLSDLSFHAVRAAYWNVAGSSTSVSARWRWTGDAERLQLDLSVPRLAHVPTYATASYLDRDERWDFGSGTSGLRLRLTKISVRKTIPLDVPRLSMTVGLAATRRRTERLESPATAAAADLARFQADLAARSTAWLLTELKAAAPPVRLPSGWEVRPSFRLGVDGGLVARGGTGRYGRFSADADARGVRTMWGWRQAFLAAAIHGGAVSRGAVIEDHFVLGLGPDADVQLRAHPFMRGGAPGAAPLAGSFVSANLTAAQDVVRVGLLQLGVVAFLDSALVTRAHPAMPDGRRFVDGGIGVELASSVQASRRVRVQWGHDLRTGGDIACVTVVVR